MSYEVEVVIPLGPVNPKHDAPVNNLLEFCLKNIKSQTIPVKLTCAIDSDLKQEKIDIVNKYADKIKVFGTHSYHRPGGIWNKIFTCWEESDCDFVCAQGYDDYSSLNRFEKQLQAIKETNTNSNLCSCFVDDTLMGKNISKVHNGNIDFRKTIGNHTLFMGAYLLRKNYIINSGISEFRNLWSAYFEGLLNLYIMKGGKPSVSSEAEFYYRNQPAMISENAQEYQDWVQKVRTEINYTASNALMDFHRIPYEGLIEELRNRTELGNEIGEISWLFDKNINA
jgi:hypothetical protein